MATKFVAVSKTFGRFSQSWETEAEAWQAIKGAVNPMWHDMPDHWEAPTVEHVELPNGEPLAELLSEGAMLGRVSF